MFLYYLLQLLSSFIGHWVRLDFEQFISDAWTMVRQIVSRALTTLFGNGAGTFRIGKNSVVSTKIGKEIQCFMKFLLSD